MNKISYQKTAFLLTLLFIFMMSFFSNCVLTMGEERIAGGKTVEKNLAFNIQPIKKKFSSDVPVVIKGVMKNVSDKSFYLNKTFYVSGSKVENKGYGIALQIINPKNEKVEFRILYEMKGPDKNWFIKLEPNKSFSNNIQIDIQKFCKDKGKFKITAFYYNFVGDEFGIPADVWKGTVESNTVEIQVL